jgi:hypothetical protein
MKPTHVGKLCMGIPCLSRYVSRREGEDGTWDIAVYPWDVDVKRSMSR